MLGDALRFWLWCHEDWVLSFFDVRCKVPSLKTFYSSVSVWKKWSHTHTNTDTHRQMHDFCSWLNLRAQTAVSCYWNQYFIAIFFRVHILKLSSKYYWKNLLLPAQVVVFLWGLHYIFSFILVFCAGVTISKCELKVCSLISFSKPCSDAENVPHMCRHMSLI